MWPWVYGPPCTVLPSVSTIVLCLEAPQIYRYSLRRLDRVSALLLIFRKDLIILSLHRPERQGQGGSGQVTIYVLSTCSINIHQDAVPMLVARAKDVFRLVGPGAEQTDCDSGARLGNTFLFSTSSSRQSGHLTARVPWQTTRQICCIKFQNGKCLCVA